MAEGKKSYISYADEKQVTDMLDDLDLGLYYRYVVAYVNDENPSMEDLPKHVQMAAKIRITQLKRDLVKYDEKRGKWSAAGKASAAAKRLQKLGRENQRNATKSTNVENVETEQKNTPTPTESTNVKNVELDAKNNPKTTKSTNVENVEGVSTEANNAQRSSTDSTVNVNDSVTVTGNVNGSVTVRKIKKSKTTRFVPPSASQVESFSNEENLHIDPERFVNFYESKGWMVGRSKMSNWKAAARNAKKWCVYEMAQVQAGQSVGQNYQQASSQKKQREY